jgi:hypothetical protein
MGSVRPARRFDAHRALAIRGLPSRPKSDGGPPCAFALLQRSIAAPPHRPADREAGTSDDASSPGLPCRTTHDGAADPHLVGLPAPRRAASGVSTPIAASTTVPPGALRHRSVPRLPPARRSPRADRDSFRSPLPSWRCSRRFASPPWGACGRGRLQGFDPGANSCWPPRPEGRGASMPSWGSPFRALSPSGLGPGFGSRGLPSHARRPYVGTGQRHRVLRPKGSVGPSRGYRLSWDSSPRNRRGDVPTGPQGGLMVSPHGSPRHVRREPIRAPSHPTRPTPKRRPIAAVFR